MIFSYFLFIVFTTFIRILKIIHIKYLCRKNTEVLQKWFTYPVCYSSALPQDHMFFSFYPLNLMYLLLERKTGIFTSGQNMNPQPDDSSVTNPSILSFCIIVTLFTRNLEHKQHKKLPQHFLWRTWYEEPNTVKIERGTIFCLGLSRKCPSQGAIIKPLVWYNYVKNSKWRENPTLKNEVALSVTSIFLRKDRIHAAKAENKWKEL